MVVFKCCNKSCSLSKLCHLRNLGKPCYGHLRKWRFVTCHFGWTVDSCGRIKTKRLNLKCCNNGGHWPERAIQFNGHCNHDFQQNKSQNRTFPKTTTTRATTTTTVTTTPTTTTKRNLQRQRKEPAVTALHFGCRQPKTSVSILPNKTWHSKFVRRFVVAN